MYNDDDIGKIMSELRIILLTLLSEYSQRETWKDCDITTQNTSSAVVRIAYAYCQNFIHANLSLYNRPQVK